MPDFKAKRDWENCIHLFVFARGKSQIKTQSKDYKDRQTKTHGARFSLEFYKCFLGFSRVEIHHLYALILNENVGIKLMAAMLLFNCHE